MSTRKPNPRAHVMGPYWESASQIGPGFRYWTVMHPTGGEVGVFRTLAAAERVAKAYNDPKATRASIDAARRNPADKAKERAKILADARRLAREIHEARCTRPGSDERAESMKWKAMQDARTENPARRRNPVIRPTGSYADQDRQERAILARLQAIHDRIAATGFRTHAAALATFLEHAKGYSFGLARLRKAEVKWRENAKELEADAARYGRIANPAHIHEGYDAHGGNGPGGNSPGPTWTVSDRGAGVVFRDSPWECGSAKARAEAFARKIVASADPGAVARDEVAASDARRVAWVAKHYGTPIRNPAKRRKATRAKKGKTSQAQEYQFDRSTFTIARVKEWLKKNGHKYGKITEGPEYFHAEQYPASDYERTRDGGHGGLRTFAVGKHVNVTVGIPLPGSDAYDKRGYKSKGPRQGRLFSRKPVASSAPYNAEDVLY